MTKKTFLDIYDWPDEIIRVALIAVTRMGKTTFAAANAKGVAWGIDSDKGFSRARKHLDLPELLAGPTLRPTRRGCIVPLYIFQEAEAAILNKNVDVVVVDSVTKIYERWVRPAVMAGRMSAQARTDAGFSKNKAANLQDKADAINVLTLLASYGTDIFYLWHQKETVDMTSKSMDKIMRDNLSDEERRRILTSVDIVLRFDRIKGNYAVYVDPDTRGFGSQKPNTDFWLYDLPGAYWIGAIPRLYSMIYTTFTGQDSAVAWAMDKLKKEDPVEIGAWYEQIRSAADPKTPSDMWVAWMLAVEEQLMNGNGSGPGEEDLKEPLIVKNEKGKDEPVTTPPPPPPPPEEPSEEPEIIEEPVKAEVKSTELPDLDYQYGNGDEVAVEDKADFAEFWRRFNRDPFEATLLHRAVSINEDWPK